MTRWMNPAEIKAGEKVSVEGLLKQRQSRRLSWRRMLALALTAVVIAAGISYGSYYWRTGRFLQSTDDAYVQADSTIISPKIAGYLSQVLVGDNQAVKAGQPLATIDDRDYVAALDQAKADVATAQAEIDTINAQLKQQGDMIAQAKATVAVDQANLTYAEQENARYGDLAARGAGSIQTAQQALSHRDTARAQLARDTAAVTAAEQQVSVLQAQLAKARAALQHSQAVQEQAQLNVGYCKIVAPIDGVVGNRSLRVGQFVQPGTQLMALVPLASTYVVANFEETQVGDVHPGQPAEIVADTFSGTTVKGHVDSLAPASGEEFALLPPDNATGNFTKIVQRIPVKIVVDPNDSLHEELRPGMSVTATVDTRAAAAPHALASN